MQIQVQVDGAEPEIIALANKLRETIPVAINFDERTSGMFVLRHMTSGGSGHVFAVHQKVEDCWLGYCVKVLKPTRAHEAENVANFRKEADVFRLLGERREERKQLNPIAPRLYLTKENATVSEVQYADKTLPFFVTERGFPLGQLLECAIESAKEAEAKGMDGVSAMLSISGRLSVQVEKPPAEPKPLVTDDELAAATGV